MTRRLVILAVLCLLCSGYLARMSGAEAVPLRQPLAELPMTIDGWSGTETARFSPQIERVLGVDEYISRTYAENRNSRVSLYMGYYQSQRQGDTIHSPLNCLPGAGWQPVASGRASISVGNGSEKIEVNQYVIQKGLERQVVLYWYQSHGRVVASEYASKAYMVLDAIRTNRTDAALVRITSPIGPGDPDGSAAAARATRFVQSVFPLLRSYLPS